MEETQRDNFHGRNLFHCQDLQSQTEPTKPFNKGGRPKTEYQKRVEAVSKEYNLLSHKIAMKVMAIIDKPGMSDLARKLLIKDIIKNGTTNSIAKRNKR